MAKIKLSPILTEAHGRLGNLVIYRRWNEDYARRYVKGRNPDTEAQRVIRRTFGDAVRSWQALTADEKNKFNRKANHLKMSGYNLYISGYMKMRIPVISKSCLKRSPGDIYLSPNQKPIPSVSPPFHIRLQAFPEKRSCRNP